MEDKHELKINGHRIPVSVRDVAYFVGLGLAVVGIYFLSTNRIKNTEIAITDLYNKNSEIVTIVAQQDKNGTRKSHETDALQQQQIDQNSGQVTEINRTLRELGPKVDKIDTNVLWLMAKQLEHK